MGAAQSNTDFDCPLRDGYAGRILRGRRRQQSRMLRTRLTWVIVGGVATRLIVAGVDALRSSKNELPAVTTTAATTSQEGAEVTLPRCARGQITISLEVRRRIVVNAVENVGSGPCHMSSVMLGMTMEDPRASAPSQPQTDRYSKSVLFLVHGFKSSGLNELAASKRGLCSKLRTSFEPLSARKGTALGS
jgi:hypothetical protein